MIYGSRHLNDNGPVFGLNVFDLVGAMGVLVGAAKILEGTNFEFLSLPLAGGVLVALIPIRLRTGRKIIRDKIRYALLRCGVNHGRLHGFQRLP